QLLNFISSLTTAFELDAQENPVFVFSGLNAQNVPTFTPGEFQDGSTLEQNPSNRQYTLTRTDGSQLVFDANGNLLRDIDNRGYTLTYGYSSGKLLTISDAAGQTVTLTYDGNGRIQSVVAPESTGLAQRRVVYNYDGAGRLIRVDIQALQTNDTYLTARNTQYEYNADDQLVGIIGPDGVRTLTNAPDLRGRSDMRQDALGNMVDYGFTLNESTGARTTQSVDMGTTGLNDPTAQGLDALRYFVTGSTNVQQFDSSARTTMVMDANGNAFHFDYTGDLQAPTSIALPTDGRPTISIQRNAASLPTVITDPANTGATPVQITYTAANKPDTVVDSKGRVTKYTYTAWNDIETVTVAFGTALAATTTYNYNAQKLLDNVVDALGRTVVRYTYDSLDRVTSVTDADGITQSVTYDSLGRIERVYDPRLTGAVDFSEYTYNDNDQVTNIATPTGSITSIYDGTTHRLIATTDLTGNTTQYEYSPEGQLIKEIRVSSSGNAVTEYVYGRRGELVALIAPEGHRTAFRTDALGQQTDVIEDDNVSPVNTIAVQATSPTTASVQVVASEPILVARFQYWLEGQPQSSSTELSLRLNDQGQFNFDLSGLEATSTYHFELRTTDRVGQTSTQSGTFSSFNNTPVVMPALFAVAENSGNGTIVGSVSASDADPNQTLTYSIASGNTGNAFSINSSTGEIAVANMAALDFETTPVFQLTIQALDNGLPAESGSATVTVNLLNELEGNPSAVQLILPMYQYPLSAPNTLSPWWQQAFDGASATTPLTIIANPNSGPISASDSGYADWITGLTKLRTNPYIRILGYVRTRVSPESSTVRTSVEILADVDAYGAGFKHPTTGASLIDGIFLDEMSNNSTDVVTYASVTSAIRNRTSLAGRLVVGNPGTTVPVQYLDQNAADIFIVREGTPGDFIGNALPGYVTSASYAAIGFGAMIHDASGTTVLAQMLREAKLRGLDYIFVTDDNGANPYDQSPAYFAELLRDIHAPFIAATSFSLPENATTGTILGTPASGDPDPGQALSYSIVSGNVDGAFQINPSTGELTVNNAAALNFATNPAFTLSVRVTDDSSEVLTDEVVITVNVTNVNEDPTDIGLSNASVAEGQPVGTTVGTFSTTDPDTGNTFTYTLVSGTGSTDNGSFTIDASGNLKTAAVFSYATQNSYSIRVRSTDQGGLFTEKVFIVNITNVNAAPSVSLSNQVTTLPDDTDTTSRVKVADIVVSDDGLGTNNLSLTGADAALFEIAGSELFLKAGSSLSATGNPTLDVTVNVDDASIGGNPDDSAALSISVTPTGGGGGGGTETSVTLDNGDVGFSASAGWASVSGYGYENDLLAAGPKGTKTAAWEFTGLANGTYDIFTTWTRGGDRTSAAPYEFFSGGGSSLGSALVDQKLDPNGDVDLTGTPFQKIGTVEVLDGQLTVTLTNAAGGAVIADAVHIQQTGGGGPINTPPTITDQSFSIAENSGVTRVVGTVVANEPDAGQSLTYTITAGNIGNVFAIDPSSGELSVSVAGLDYETLASYALTVLVTDDGSPNRSNSATITVNVTNVNEDPTDIGLSNASVAEG
ncbi:MAG: cadherin domain-containing protein, partial [Planctomycetaceae bacterium]|nr:cadherin domain-containing protein [Planctomycetaceae bacterium]